MYKVRVLKYYVENKAIFENKNKVNENKVLSYREALRCDNQKQRKSCFPLCPNYKFTTVLN